LKAFIQLTQVGDDPDTYQIAIDKIVYVQETAAGSTRVHLQAGNHVSVREPFRIILDKIRQAEADAGG